jgi:hypothetical protein
MATDFYSLQKRVPAAVKQRAKHWTAKVVGYQGERGVIIGRWWRRSTNEILYDVKQIPNGKVITIHSKIPETAITDWKE